MTTRTRSMHRPWTLFATAAVAVTVAAAAAIATAPATAAEEKKAEEKKAEAPKGLEFTAVVLPPASSAKQAPSEIRIVIDRFTTPEEKASLRATLESKGQLAALTQAQEHPIGRLVRAGGRGVNILFAAKEATEKGEQIVIVSQRAPIYEDTIMNVAGTDAPFTIAWFIPVSGGKGEGTIIGVTALKMDEQGEVKISTYPASKANLTNVKAR